MTREELGEIVAASLRAVAPEADLEGLEPDDSLREELDLDSMDFLAFVRGLHAATGVDVPELDYPQLDSLEGAVGYLLARVG